MPAKYHKYTTVLFQLYLTSGKIQFLILIIELKCLDSTGKPISRNSSLSNGLHFFVVEIPCDAVLERALQYINTESSETMKL